MQTTTTPATSEELIAEARSLLAEARDVAEIDGHIDALNREILRLSGNRDTAAVLHLAAVRNLAVQERASRLA